MLADHSQPMLDTARDTSLLFQFASVLACGHAPPTAVEAIRMGRIEETHRRGAWHHRRGRSPQTGREINGQTDGSEGGSSHGTMLAHETLPSLFEPRMKN